MKIIIDNKHVGLVVMGSTRLIQQRCVLFVEA